MPTLDSQARDNHVLSSGQVTSTRVEAPIARLDIAAAAVAATAATATSPSPTFSTTTTTTTTSTAALIVPSINFSDATPATTTLAQVSRRRRQHLSPLDHDRRHRRRRRCSHISIMIA